MVLACLALGSMTLPQRHVTRGCRCPFRYCPRCGLSSVGIQIVHYKVVPVLCMGVEYKAGFTWKTARSGRATELAAQGMPVTQIMDLGEWKSSAFFNYIDVSAVDAAEMWRLADLEDDEEDTVAWPGPSQRAALGVTPQRAPVSTGPDHVAAASTALRGGGQPARCSGVAPRLAPW